MGRRPTMSYDVLRPQTPGAAVESAARCEARKLAVAAEPCLPIGNALRTQKARRSQELATPKLTEVLLFGKDQTYIKLDCSSLGPVRVLGRVVCSSFKSTVHVHTSGGIQTQRTANTLKRPHEDSRSTAKCPKSCQVSLTTASASQPRADTALSANAGPTPWRRGK